MSSGKTQSRMLYGELRIVLPEEWENRTVYTFTAPGSEGEMMPGVPLKQSVTVMKMDLPPGSSLEKMAHGLFASSANAQLKIVEIKPPHSCLVGGRNAWQRHSSLESTMTRFEQIQCLIEVRQKLFLFTLLGKSPLSDDRAAWFEQFLLELKFAE